MVHLNRSMEDSDDECDLSSGCLNQVVSEVKNVSMWSKNRSCDILVKNVTIFCPCPKSLPKSKVKQFGLSSLAEEISEEPSIYSVLWLVLVMLI